MNHYELLYIIPSQYTEEELKPIIERISQLIREQGAEITFEGNLGRRKLAYPIKQIHQGYYHILEFNLEAKKTIKELNDILKLENQILRHLITSKKLKTAEELKKEREFQEKREKAELKSETQKIQEIKTEVPKKKISMEELDKKLDEILEKEVI